MQSDRLGFAKKLFEKTGSTIVLKGAGTIVASGEKVFINPTGNPGMASAGTGDVLSGIIGAFLSQGIPDVLSACAGVYLHGLCGDEVAQKHGEIGLLATDILNELPVVINSFVEKSPTRGALMRSMGRDRQWRFTPQTRLKRQRNSEKIFRKAL